MKFKNTKKVLQNETDIFIILFYFILIKMRVSNKFAKFMLYFIAIATTAGAYASYKYRYEVNYKNIYLIYRKIKKM